MKAQFAERGRHAVPARARAPQRRQLLHDPRAAHRRHRRLHARASRAREYGKLLGQPFEPLPAGTPAGYETLRTHANAYLAKGGVVGITCTGGKGGLALVCTESANARGYDLITIYDD